MNKMKKVRNKKKFAAKLKFFLQEKKKTIAKTKAFLLANKKYVFAMGALVVAAGVAVMFFYLKPISKEKVDEPLTLIDQYRQQLPELEKKSKEGNVNDLQQYGVALYVTGNLEKAEEIYRKQIQIDDKNVLAHNNLANTLRDEKKFDQAVEEYKKAIELSPKATNSYFNLASVYQYSLKDFDKAIEIYEKGMTANPEVVDFPNMAGLAAEQKGDTDKAEKYFQKALSVQADNQTAKAGLERLKK